ncbi:MAG: hypothetical protein Q9227_000720 [Pyrenula ochraceoflavens]
MHSASLLLATFLYSLSVVAFYPYSIKKSTSGKDERHKRFYPLSPDIWDGSTDAPTLVIEKKPISKSIRDNKYIILKSDPPTVPSSLAVDQDGSDFSFVVTLLFGSSKTPLYMLLDTGASNTWLMSSDCTTSACNSHNTFGASDSKSFRPNSSATWDVTYGTGSVSGIGGTDSVSFAGYTLQDFGFGMATNASDDFNSYVMDGILGLGRDPDNQIGTPSIMSALKSRNLIQQNTIGVHFRRHAEKPADGVLTFGMINKDVLDGDLSYTTTVPGSTLWEIPAGGFGVDGKPAPLQPNTTVIVDTGTSWILLPPTDAAALHGMIPGSKQNGASYQVPCDSSAVVQFTFSDVTYNVSSKDYVGAKGANSALCASNIVGHQAFGPNTWLLGDVFLKNVYTVFDFGDGNGKEGRIGFGKVKAVPTASTSTSTSTSAGEAATAKASGSGSRTAASTTASTASPSQSGGSQQGMGLGNGAGLVGVPRMMAVSSMLAGCVGIGMLMA